MLEETNWMDWSRPMAGREAEVQAAWEAADGPKKSRIRVEAEAGCKVTW